MNKDPKVAIVTTLAFDSHEDVKNYLEEIKKINYSNYVLIIINNNPKFTWLPELLKNYNNTILINSKGNIGICAAYNVGIRRAIKEKARFTMLLNRDVKISRKTISELLAVLLQNDNSAMVSPVIIRYHESNKIDFAGGYFNRIFYYYRTPRGRFVFRKTNPFPIGSVTGCCVLIKNRLIRKIGWFDEDLFLYFDDPDISIKVYDAGYKCYLLPKPLVKHMKKTTKFAPYEAYYFGRNPFIMIRKHAKGFYKITGYFGQFFIRLPRNATRMQSLRSLYMYLVGMFDGIRGITGKAKYF